MEIAVGIVAFSVLVYLLRSMLVYGETTLTHDNYYWYYPVFQFFAESIINGHYPLWNPFSHGGEAFFPIPFQFHLLDPLTWMIIYSGHFFTNDTVMLFNWTRILQSIFMGFGVYIVLRPFAKHPFIRMALIPILFYSSFMLGACRQDAILNQFTWVPFITYFLLRIVYYKDYRWGNWLAFSALVGLKFQSYFFSGVWVFFLFFIVGTAVFRRDLLRDLLKSGGAIPKLIAASAVIVLMMMPNIVLMLGKDNSVYPARMITLSGDDLASTPMGGPQQFEGHEANMVQAIKMPYDMIAYSGSFSHIWDFIQIISPEGNQHIGWPDKGKWGYPSEAYIYLGMLPWAIIVLGMLAGTHDLKRVWLVIMFGFGLLMLGPAGGLHRLLYQVYPPLWFIRHTHAFVLYLVFALLYFFVLGCNHLYCTWKGPLFGARTGGQGKNLFGFPGINHTTRTAVVVLIFLVFSLISAYHMTREAGNGIREALPYLILIFVAGWILLGSLGRKWLYLGILTGHICTVFYFTNNPYYFFKYIVIVIGLPVVLFLIARSSGLFSSTMRNYMPAAVFAVIFIIACGDLLYSFHQSKFLYGKEKNPSLVLDINTSLQKPSSSQMRYTAPAQYIANTGQSIRYLSLLHKRPYVFSPIMEKDMDLPGDSDEFTSALRSKRWSSFSLPKSYFALINSDVPPLAMKEMFAVDKPLFQFKQGIVQTDEGGAVVLLSKLGTYRSVQLLDRYVLVDKKTNDSPLMRFKISSSEYNDTIRNVSYKQKSPQNNKGFSYSIDKYDYNSMTVEVSSVKDGVLYWSDGYDKNWHAYINGQEVHLYRANINFKAIVLPEGTSHIRFVYEYPLFESALFVFFGVFIISVTTALSLYIYQRYRRVKKVRVTTKGESYT